MTSQIRAALQPARARSAVAIADSLTARQWDQLTDEVLHRLERRMRDELDRRGRRVTPRVF